MFSQVFFHYIENTEQRLLKTRQPPLSTTQIYQGLYKTYGVLKHDEGYIYILLVNTKCKYIQQILLKTIIFEQIGSQMLIVLPTYDNDKTIYSKYFRLLLDVKK